MRGKSSSGRSLNCIIVRPQLGSGWISLGFTGPLSLSSNNYFSNYFPYCLHPRRHRSCCLITTMSDAEEEQYGGLSRAAEEQEEEEQEARGGHHNDASRK